MEKIISTEIGREFGSPDGRRNGVSLQGRRQFDVQVPDAELLIVRQVSTAPADCRLHHATSGRSRTRSHVHTASCRLIVVSSRDDGVMRGTCSLFISLHTQTDLR